MKGLQRTLMKGPAFTLPYEMEARAAMNVNVHQTKGQCFRLMWVQGVVALPVRSGSFSRGRQWGFEWRGSRK